MINFRQQSIIIKATDGFYMTYMNNYIKAEVMGELEWSKEFLHQQEEEEELEQDVIDW